MGWPGEGLGLWWRVWTMKLRRVARDKRLCSSLAANWMGVAQPTRYTGNFFSWLRLTIPIELPVTATVCKLEIAQCDVSTRDFGLNHDAKGHGQSSAASCNTDLGGLSAMTADAGQADDSGLRDTGSQRW